MFDQLRVIHEDEEYWAEPKSRQVVVLVFLQHVANDVKSICKRKTIISLNDTTLTRSRLTLFVFLDELVRTPDRRVRLRPRDLIGKVVQRLVAENPFYDADYQNARRNNQKHWHD